MIEVEHIIFGFFHCIIRCAGLYYSVNRTDLIIEEHEYIDRYFIDPLHLTDGKEHLPDVNI